MKTLPLGRDLLTATRGRVLVVDDEPELLQASLFVLSDAGFSVWGASSTAECLNALRTELPDLILLDIRLADLSGVELCQQIKANPDTAGVTVVHLSSRYASSEEQACGLECGADGYIVRPIGNRELIAFVDATLKVMRTEKELHRLGEQLKKKSEALNRMMDLSLDVICTVNANGEFVELSAAAERTWGYSREELIGRRSIEMVHPADRIATEAAAAATIAGKPMRDFENRFYCKDGSVVHVMWSAFWSPTDEMFFCVARDVTERRKLEQQFLRAQRMESIGTLAGGIAHDLNNVLSPIAMSMDLLKLKSYDADSLEMIDIIETNVLRGADMVRQILTFARGVDGQRLLVNPQYLLRDIQKIARETFRKDLQVEIAAAPALWNVVGDATQLHQVLLNLCVNARDAMPNGGAIKITAENLILDAHYAAMHPEVQPGPYIVIEVLDHGMGMTAKTLEKIFDPFFTTKEIGKGTGLGLSTSLAIVRSHSGFIRVYSEVGKGSSFKVHLPADTGLAEDFESPASTSLPRGSGELILVIDDEHSIRTITQQTLEAFGYRCLLATDGADAVALYTKNRAEVAGIITDLMMPVMDGPTAVQIMRKLNPKLPVIATSGISSQGHVTKFARREVKHFLPKPYTAETLLLTLKEVLSGAA